MYDTVTKKNLSSVSNARISIEATCNECMSRRHVMLMKSETSQLKDSALLGKGFGKANPDLCKECCSVIKRESCLLAFLLAKTVAVPLFPSLLLSHKWY